MAALEGTWHGQPVTIDHPNPVAAAALLTALEHLERSSAAGRSDQAQVAEHYAEAALRCTQAVATLEKQGR